MRTCIALFSSTLLLSAPVPGLAAPAPAAPQAATPPPGAPLCVVADDAEYGWIREKPGQVGGSPMYGAARQRRFIEALRGLNGERVAYKRLGSTLAPGRETPLDMYELTYEGLEKPRTLFLDWYNYVEPKAPQGFRCGQPMNLGVPPPDPFKALPQLAQLASAEGPAREVPPTPLDARRPEYGVAYDYFALLARAARAAAARGQTRSGDQPPGHLAGPQTVVMAPPLACDGKTVVPVDVALVTPQGGPVRPQPDVSADAIAALLPGVEVPARSRVAVYQLTGLVPGLTVKITYDGPACPAGATEVSLPVDVTPSKLLESSSPALPPDTKLTAATVAVQALLDDRGAFREGFAMGGPAELSRAALDALASWRAEPTRVNGVPTPTPVVVLVTFKAAPPQ